MELEAGNVLAQRYRIIRQLGRGGMGEVFAAENIRTGRIVAVKVLRADSKQKSSAVARFRREARAAGAINSDHVTQVLDVEEDDQHGIIIVFELLEGESLIDRLKRTGPMTFDELFPVVEQVWMGLVDAHKAGVIHRDLKPSNVFLERRPDGITRVKILDFGISKLPREVGGETLTEMGQSLGTFSFMPPEQIGKAKTVDHRADIYACATLIYQAMSGQLPYGAKNILQMVDLKTKSEPRPLASVLDGPVDPKLEGFLKKGLSRDPGDRYQSAQEALDVWRELKRTTGRSISSSSNPAYAPNTPFQQPQTNPSAYGQQAQQHQAQHQQPQQQQQHQQQQPSTGQFAQPGANYPQFAGAAAAPQSFANTPQPTSSGGYPPSRSPATVMLTDPSRLAVSPLPTNYGRQTNAPAQPPPQNINPRLGGTVAMTGSTGAPINVPILNDTSSEGPDQVATLAMPMRNVSAAVAASLAAKGYGPAGTPHQGMATPQQQSNASAPAQPTNIPRLHDDSGDRGQQGTQLMSHASLRQAGVPIPTGVRQTGRSTGLPQSDGGQGQQQQQQPAPASQVAPQSQVASSQSSSAAAQGSAEPETSVYRRETHGPRASTTTGRDPNSSGVFANPVSTTSSATNNPVLATAPAPKRSNLGIILGVIAFALVGFGVAAVLLRYLQAR